MVFQVTREQLEQALKAARCTGDLDTALLNPALRIALRNTAEALSRIATKPIKHRLRFDARRAAAGDND